jgi:predicted DNA-binding antitoxin AbrB/MazE fold protein
MTALTIEATYEQGVLKPHTPLPLKEHQTVRITIHSPVDLVKATSGMLGWKGDAETVERVALDPEFGVRESP